MEAYPLAKGIKSQKQIVEVTEKLSKTNQEIRNEKKKHMISLLKGYPLVQKGVSVQNIGPISSIPLNFRTQLQQRLQNLDKNICVRFDIGSRQNLRTYLDQRCKLLHISSGVSDSDHLVLEKQTGIADKLTFQDFDELVGGDMSTYGVKMVVLAMPLSFKLGEYIYQNLNVRHVIAFNFIHYPKNGKPLHLYETIQVAIQKFCVEFYAALTCQQTVRNAYLQAKQFMDNFIDRRVIQYRQEGLYDKIFDDWFKNLPKNEPCLFNEISSDHDKTLFRNIDQGIPAYVDLSPPRGPCNIQKPNQIFVGRQTDLHHVIALLQQFKCVHITGAEGTGRTELLKQLGYYLNTRKAYTDGIYILNLNGVSSITQVYQLLQEVGLAFYSNQINPKSFLYQQKLLLIFDNCDSLIQRAEHTFTSLLRLFLEECHISLVLTSTLIDLSQEQFNISKWVLKNLTHQESMQFLFKYSPQFCLQEFNRQDEKAKFNSLKRAITKDANGEPKKLKACARWIEGKDLSKMWGMTLKMFKGSKGASEPSSPKDEGMFMQLTLTKQSTQPAMSRYLTSENLQSSYNFYPSDSEYEPVENFILPEPTRKLHHSITDFH